MSTPTVRFTSRTAEQIREDLIRMIPDIAPSWTSHGEDEPGIALVEMLSGVADGLHYYFDKQALETFLPSVRLRRNALNLAHLVGYRPRRRVAATGTIRVITTRPLTFPIFIPELTQFTTQTGVKVVNTTDVFLPAGFSGVKTIRAVQGEIVSEEVASPGGDEAIVTLTGKNPSEQGFTVRTFGQTWTEFRDSQPEDPDNLWYHYFEDDDGQISVRFLRSLGNVPMAGTPIEVSYLLSQDMKISSAVPLSTPSIPDPEGLTEAQLLTHQEALESLVFETGVMLGYRDRETVSVLRYRAPVSIKAKNRAVSENDYRFLARQFGGVKDIKVVMSDFYTRQVQGYLLMENGDDPPADLLTEVEEYLDDRNDLTLDVVVSAALLQPFRCRIEVKENDGYSSALATYEVREELLKFFANEVLDFGRSLRIGELYNVANRPDSVRYVNVTELYWEDGVAGVTDLFPASDLHVPIAGTFVVTTVTE